MSLTDSYFSEILSPYSKPQTLSVLANEGELCSYKVLLNKSQKKEEFVNDQNKPYLLISKQCFDHANTFLYIQNFYQQYHFAHPAIMKLLHLSISPNNSFEAYYNFPENGKLSEYIGFSHENNISESKVLTPTQKSIISYGLAHALRYIHQHGYQFGEVNAKNVYLDSDFHPYLTNFYSIKKVDDQRLPESKRITDMHLKLDVLTYSIIYAALIEPVAFNPPVKSAKEFFQRFNNKKRPVCEKATDEQRDVLDKMWDWVPRDRLSFDEIINCFESEELIFPGTNMEEFNKYKNYLDENQDKSQVPPSPSHSPSSPHNQPSSSYVKHVAQIIVNDNNSNNEQEISIHNDEIDDLDINPNTCITRQIPQPDSYKEEEDNNINKKEQNNFEEEEEDVDFVDKSHENVNNEKSNDEDIEENNDDKFEELENPEKEININHEEENNENAAYLEEEEIEDSPNTGENINDSDGWQPRENDSDEEKIFNDGQPTEKDDQFDIHSDNENENNQDDSIKDESIKDDQSNEQPEVKESIQNDEKINNTDDKVNVKNEEENLEKKLNILVRRHDDRGFKESDDSSSSNHSYLPEDENDDALMQTQSVDSDIPFINTDGDVQVEAD